LINKMKHLVIFILSVFVVLSAQSHQNHPPTWETDERVRNLEQRMAENEWRDANDAMMQSQKESDAANQNAFGTIIGLLSTPFYVGWQTLVYLDSQLLHIGSLKCEICKEYVDSAYEHRTRCSAGHFYWGCHRQERINHKYCPDHPTDCRRCAGGGCYLCWDPDNNVAICLKCGESGAHHCSS